MPIIPRIRKELELIAVLDEVAQKFGKKSVDDQHGEKFQGRIKKTPIPNNRYDPRKQIEGNIIVFLKDSDKIFRHFYSLKV